MRSRASLILGSQLRASDRTTANSQYFAFLLLQIKENTKFDMARALIGGGAGEAEAESEDSHEKDKEGRGSAT